MIDNNLKIAFYTLGCKVNQYETQALKETFKNRGFMIVDEHKDADIYVVNTCTVTNLADRKSRQYIRRMKKQNPESIIAVIGCYAQVSPDEASAIEGVDIVVGNNEKNSLPDYVDGLLNERILGKREEKPIVHILSREELTYYEGGSAITTMESRTRAYIKIQDGCDQFCSYCIIPYARGPVRSRPSKEIIMEAESLLKKGFKELVLTGINTALYGAENRRNAKTGIYDIESIVKCLNDLPGDFRIRLGSLEPTVVDVNLAVELLKYEKLCHHMHLSLQSGSDSILRSMNRHYDRSGYLKIVDALRKEDKFYGISTDVIVGFPGEKDDDFKDSIDLVRQVRFVKTHVFPYSKRKGTKAATMDDHLDNQTKKKRSAKLTQVAEESALSFLKSTIESVRKVLFEEYEESTGLVSGYSDNFIKVYYQVSNRKTAEEMINTLVPIRFKKLYLDGILGEPEYKTRREIRDE
ncbi:MAG TPA: tRNA (N(6)-L-threonylcarbamoyladenosine(37)-C(2))-methylthiotransferase MtaB [Anaerovoracaceae bacterium]|nr:tRNA (N(6)-L-threonylcarbamoyladenosine(37)-C(2))-methylthiotransferase MtaB [Anaerovoracaceae bacterium]